MTKMRIVQISEPKGAFELVEREVPEPGPRSVRLKIQACGVCHSDFITKEAIFPFIQYPRVPGHEIAGVIDALGDGVKGWTTGQRAGVGWYGGHCGYCDSCRRGDFMTCQSAPHITGVSFDGGYAEYMIAPSSTLALIPEGLSAVDAAPLMCAGVTTFNSLRNSGARPGDTVAVLGLGGLGHLAVQFAAKMGFRTIAIARGKDKEALAKKLGAVQYIDSQAQDASAELQKSGGARVVAATATSGKAMSEIVGGLGVDGRLIVLGVPGDPLEIDASQLIMARRSIAGCPSGTSIDIQDTLSFCMLAGVRPMTEVFPLERAAEAYERMMSGKARFRVVLTTGS